MDPGGFDLRRRFDGRTAARAAFDEMLATAQRCVRLFDDHGEFWGLERSEVAETLGALLRRRRDAQVVLVLQRTDHVELHAPRLLDQLARCAPRLQILRSGAALRRYTRGLVLVDESAVLRRPHFDRALAWLDHDDSAIAAAAALFEDIVAQSEPGIASRVTGL